MLQSLQHALSPPSAKSYELNVSGSELNGAWQAVGEHTVASGSIAAGNLYHVLLLTLVVFHPFGGDIPFFDNGLWSHAILGNSGNNFISIYRIFGRDLIPSKFRDGDEPFKMLQ